MKKQFGPLPILSPFMQRVGGGSLLKGVIIMQLKGKKVIILGERDGIQGPAIAACLQSAGADPLLVQTQCFV